MCPLHGPTLHRFWALHALSFTFLTSQAMTIVAEWLQFCFQAYLQPNFWKMRVAVLNCPLLHMHQNSLLSRLQQNKWSTTLWLATTLLLKRTQVQSDHGTYYSHHPPSVCFCASWHWFHIYLPLPFSINVAKRYVIFLHHKPVHAHNFCHIVTVFLTVFKEVLSVNALFVCFCMSQFLGFHILLNLISRTMLWPLPSLFWIKSCPWTPTWCNAKIQQQHKIHYPLW